MGLCCNSTSNSRKNNHNQKNGSLNKIDKSNIAIFKSKYYNEGASSLLVSTVASSSKQKQNYSPEIYTINKYGIQVKTKQKLSQPLKFIFHLYDFKCKMLAENTLYILQIIFDGKEFPLSFGHGNNPSFVFNETFGKEITFEKMSTSFMEINLYTHKTMLNNNNLPYMTKGEILSQSQIFSFFKINLLTIAIAPEKHDFILIDPKRIRVQLGRISYYISCKHMEDLSMKINGFRMNLKNLKYDEIALNLKFGNKNFNKEKESEYTESFIGEPNNSENSMIYEYSDDKEDKDYSFIDEKCSCDSNYIINEENEISESKNNNENNIINTNSNNNKEENNIISNSQSISNNNINNLVNSNNNKNIIDYQNKNDKNKISEKLFLHGNMSMEDLFNSEITLNVFSVRLQNKDESNKNENKLELQNQKLKKEFFMKKLSLPSIAVSNNRRKSRHNKLLLIHSYKLIGVIVLNFNKILNELEGKISKVSYRLFQSMSNKKNSLIKTLSGSKIMKCGIEEDLTNKAQSNKNLYNINLKDNELTNRIQNLIINLLQNENLCFTEEIYWEGESIGNIEINLEISNLPLMRQIRFGVMTETGFEINSIFLYDNLNISNDLPEELIELSKLKEKFEQEIDFSILKKIKNCLEKTIEENFLYYGYSSNKDLFQGQAVIIDLGLGLFDFLDKVNFDYLHIIFEILKLILKRSEFDLGTLSVKWFRPKIVIKQKQSTYNIKSYKSNNTKSIFSFNYDEFEYEFNDDYLIESHLVEKYLNFHSQILNYCLDNLNKVKNINNESKDFTYFYLSLAFFQIPAFRETFINTISKSIDLNEPKYLKFSKYNFVDFSKMDSTSNSDCNAMLWDMLFYQKLDSSINYYSKRNIHNHNKQKKDKKNNNTIENINLIKEQLMNMKYITEIKDEKDNDVNVYKKNWYSKLRKRDYIFYDLIVELFDFMNIFRHKISINSNQSSQLFNFKNTEKMTNISGIGTILNVIYYDLIVKDAKNYPKQIKEIIPKFYTDISIINNFISLMILTTNVYDTLSIFNLLNILDDLFNKKLQYNDYDNNYIKDNVDYKLIKKSFFIIANSDNSLAIAKFIWFYYKNISILNYNHVNELINSILKTLFFKFFFHWSFQVREIFYYFIIFILGFKIKKQIKSLNEKKIDNNFIKDINKSFNNKCTIKLFEDINDDSSQRSMSLKNEIYYVENILKEDMDIIIELQKIVEKEKYDLIHKDNIEQIKDKNLLEKIPRESHGNVIECIKQYNLVYTKFVIWKKNIEDNHVPEDKIEYPKMDISLIKDDTIQYDES